MNGLPPIDRRYVKNGGLLCFEEYLDLENDSGIWKQQNLIYMDAIEKTRNLFGERLLVLTYDRLKNDQQDFVQRDRRLYWCYLRLSEHITKACPLFSF